MKFGERPTPYQNVAKALAIAACVAALGTWGLLANGWDFDSLIGLATGETPRPSSSGTHRTPGPDDNPTAHSTSPDEEDADSPKSTPTPPPAPPIAAVVPGKPHPHNAASPAAPASSKPATAAKTAAKPSEKASLAPTAKPTPAPTVKPTHAPTARPTVAPNPTARPTLKPSPKATPAAHSTPKASPAVAAHPVTKPGQGRISLPQYQAASHSLVIPVAGGMPDGPLVVRTSASGRAYVDIPGVMPSFEGVKTFGSGDGTFSDGLMAARSGASRVSFVLGRGAIARAYVATGEVHITLTTH